MALLQPLFAGNERRSGDMPGLIDRRPDSPEVIQRRRAMAAALLEQGAQTQHVDSPLEALGSIAQSFGGYLGSVRADQDERAGRESRNQALLETYDRGGFGSASQAESFGTFTGPSPSSPAGGARAAAGGPSSSSLPASFLASVDRTEGGGNYDTLFGHSQRSGPFSNVRISNMTVGQAIDFASPSGAYGQFVKGKVGHVATPMGRHQIVGSTLRRAASEMGLDPSTPFDAQTQDAVAAHLARRRVASANTTSGKIAALRSEWEGFKHVPDAQMVQIVADLESGAAPAPSAPRPVQVASLDPNEGMAAALGAQPANISPANQALATALTSDSAPIASSQAQSAPNAPSPTLMAQAQVMTGGQMPSPAPGVDRAMIARLLSNPWTEDLGQSFLMQQMEAWQRDSDPLRQIQIQAAQQELQRGQPMINAGGGQLYDPNRREWITAPGVGQGSNLPDSFQTLQLRAEAAGLVPGSPEFQSFMANGGRSSEDSAAEQRIGRMTENLMQTGDFIDPMEARNVAVGIVDGRLRTDRHPITGAMQIVDMATGRPAYGGSPEPQAPESQQMLPAPQMPMGEADRFGTQYQSGPQAFGVEGAARRVLNTVGDATGFGAPYPETQAAQADYSVLQESVLNDIAGAYGRQPPSWLLQEIRSLTPTPGSPFEGPGSAVAKLNAIGRHLLNELRLTEQSLGRSLSPTQQQEAEARLSGLQSAIARIDGAVASFGGEPEMATEGQSFQEGATATNPDTGARIIFRNGQWEPLQ